MDAENVATQARARQLLATSPDAWRSLRIRAGLTLEDVAGVLGVSAMSVSRWERGQRVARGDHAYRYLKLLNLALPEAQE